MTASAPIPRVVQSVQLGLHHHLEIGPRCVCGLYLIGERCPYCLDGQYTKARPAKPKPEPTKASMAAELDRMRADAFTRVKRDLDERMGVAVKPKRRRRTKDQIAADRAKQEQKAAAVYAEATPEWLQEADAEAEAEIAAILNGETM